MPRIDEARRREYTAAYRAKNAEILREKDRARYARNSDELRAKALERYWRNPDSNRRAAKRWKERNPEYVKEYARKNSVRYRYGLTFEQFDELRCKQNGLCAVCFLGVSGRDLDVDHDHKTGKVRGLVCNRCNRLLALMESSVGLTEKAEAYLERYAIS